MCQVNEIEFILSMSLKDFFHKIFSFPGFKNALGINGNAPDCKYGNTLVFCRKHKKAF